MGNCTGSQFFQAGRNPQLIQYTFNLLFYCKCPCFNCKLPSECVRLCEHDSPLFRYIFHLTPQRAIIKAGFSMSPFFECCKIDSYSYYFRHPRIRNKQTEDSTQSSYPILLFKNCYIKSLILLPTVPEQF